MGFDIEKVIGDIAKATADIASAEGKAVVGLVQGGIESMKEDLEECCKARICGEIGDGELSDEIEREKKILEVELLSAKIVAEAEVQRMLKAVQDIILGAVKAAL